MYKGDEKMRLLATISGEVILGDVPEENDTWWSIEPDQYGDDAIDLMENFISEIDKTAECGFTVEFWGKYFARWTDYGWEHDAEFELRNPVINRASAEVVM